VRVVPRVPRGDLSGDDYVAAVYPDPGLLAAVRARLDAARLIGTEVFVCPPRYRIVDLRVLLAGRPADRAALRRTLREALRRYLDPLVGGDDGDGFPFGGPLRPSALLRVAQAAAGDAADISAVAIGLDGAPPDEDCADVPLRTGDLVALLEVAL
jgi:hypothetical protein